MKSPSKYEEARAAREARYEATSKRVPDTSPELMKALAILLPTEPAGVAEAPKPVLREPKPAKAPPAVSKRLPMYAPPGQCEHCDRNRANALDRVKRHREKRK